MKLVAFDLDGTLIDADAVDEFAKLAGKGKQATDIRKKAIDGKLKPEEALVKRVKLLKGMECEELKEAVEKLPLMKGARKTTKELIKRLTLIEDTLVTNKDKSFIWETQC